MLLFFESLLFLLSKILLQIIDALLDELVVLIRLKMLFVLDVLVSLTLLKRRIVISVLLCCLVQNDFWLQLQKFLLILILVFLKLCLLTMRTVCVTLDFLFDHLIVLNNRNRSFTISLRVLSRHFLQTFSFFVFYSVNDLIKLRNIFIILFHLLFLICLSKLWTWRLFIFEIHLRIGWEEFGFLIAPLFLLLSFDVLDHLLVLLLVFDFVFFSRLLSADWILLSYGYLHIFWLFTRSPLCLRRRIMRIRRLGSRGSWTTLLRVPSSGNYRWSRLLSN